MPEVSIGSLQVRVDDAGTHMRQWHAATTGKRPEIVRRDRSGYVEDGKIRKVLHHVEGHVTENALVSDAVSATNNGAPVSTHVPCRPEARSEVVPVRFPKPPHVTLGCDLKTSPLKIRRQIVVRKTNGRSIPVGIEVRVLVVLHAEMLPAHAQTCG